MKEREPFFIIVIGTNRTGKTTWAKKLATFRERAIYIPSSPADDSYNDFKILAKDEKINEFKGIRRTYIFEQKSFEKLVETEVREALICLDDVKNYIPMDGPRLNNSLDKLIRNRRHLMNDLILIVHHPRDLHPDLLKFNPTLVFFRTTGAYPRSLGEKLDLEKIMAIQEEIARECTKNPYAKRIYTI